MKSRFAAFIVVAAATLLLPGGVCRRVLYPPEFISAPAFVYAGDSARVRLATHGNGYDSVRYVVNWGDVTDTTVPLGLSDTATVWHVYAVADTRYVRAAVYALDDPQGIRWTEQRRIVVEAGGSHAPVIDSIVNTARLAVIGAPYCFSAKAHDPDGDSIRFRCDWGETETTTAYFASPCTAKFSHVFTQVETATVVITAQDFSGAVSSPETVFVAVGTAGGVIWYRLNTGEFPRPIVSSPVVASDGYDERLFFSDESDHRFYSIRASDWKSQKTQTTRWFEYDFTGQPAFCEATQHIIIGSNEGELYALKVDGLGKAWQWPNKPVEESLTGLEWGAPAIRDNRLYIPHEDDSLFYFIDSVDHGVRVATFAPHGSFVDAPVIDAQGNIYFGTDSGYLYKLGPELDTVFWRTRLIANGEIRSLVVGGAIYCVSDSSRVYAVNPVTGTPLWDVALPCRPNRLALGQTALFVASSFGEVYSMNPATGAVNWDRTLSQYGEFLTTPIVAANGYVYFQDDDDVLYCLTQANGTLVWSCDCPRYLPRTGGNSHRPRKTQLNDYPPNPTILANGNIIVPGSDALYCVAGYPEGPLDPLASWPKWQHDLYNTGYVGGGR